MGCYEHHITKELFFFLSFLRIKEKKKKTRVWTVDWPSLSLTNFNHIFFLHSQFLWSVIISNFPNFKEKPGWIHGSSLFLTVLFFYFLEICRNFHLKVNLTALLYSDLEFKIFSFLLTREILSWRFCLLVRPGDGGFPRGLHIAAALGRQDFTLGFTDSCLYPTETSLHLLLVQFLII